MEEKDEVHGLLDKKVDVLMNSTGAKSVPAPANTLDMITHYPYLCRSARETHGTKRYRGSGQAMVTAIGNNLMDDARSYKESVGRQTDHQKRRGNGW